MSNKVDIKQLARFILLYCTKNDIAINHYKLQKLLYYIQAWHLIYFDKEKIFDEVPQAWINGPVYRSIYNDWKHIFAGTPIIIKDKFKDEVDKFIDKTKHALKLSAEQESFLLSVLNYYGAMSHEQLILSTHKETPWLTARKGMGQFEYSDAKITLESMYQYFKSVYDKSVAN